MLDGLLINILSLLMAMEAVDILQQVFQLITIQLLLYHLIQQELAILSLAGLQLYLVELNLLHQL